MDIVEKKIISIGGGGFTHQTDKFLPFAENPHLVNPKEGFIVSANNDPKLSLKNLRRIPGYYSNGQRYQRIKNLIQKHKGKWDLTSMRALQMDDKDSIHKKIVPVLLKSVASKKHSKNSELALKTLKDWNGSHQLKDVGPTIYYMFISHMVYYVFEKKLSGDLYRHLLGSHHLYSVTEFLINKPQSVWWNISPDLNTQEKVLQKAWSETMKTLTRDIGGNVSQWHWGKVHVLEQEHPIGKKKPFNLIFNVGPTPLTGGYETVDKESFHLSTQLPFKVKSGPSTRRLIDLVDTKSSLGINPKGQAGYFFDVHYADQLELFAKGEYREQIMDMKKVKSQNPKTLTFVRKQDPQKHNDKK